MNYRATYLKIIKSAIKQKEFRRIRKKEKTRYYEKHHILPVSIFPLWKKKKSNLVLLTAREHYFCHILLTKIYSEEKMYCALWRLIHGSKNNCCVKNSKEYQRIREKFIEKMRHLHSGKKLSEETKNKIGTSRKGHNVSQETREKIGIRNKGRKKI